MTGRTSPCNNDKNTDECPNTYKKRFKGVESFLRRIAFNLGNTPSQTEVKIISCIPIDVTDLQNKIISLERQLCEARNSKGSKNTPVHTALLDRYNPVANTNAVLYKCSEVEPLGVGETSAMAAPGGDGTSKGAKSTVSFLFPTVTEAGSHKHQSGTLDPTSSERSSDSRNAKCHKNFFRKCKKIKALKKKEKVKPQLIYYAHTDNNPFSRCDTCPEYQFAGHGQANIDQVFSKTYLANVIQRHFDPGRVVEEFSDTSHFTSPVCRDVERAGRCAVDSDTCSCCHGQFHDVDNYIGKNQNFIVDPITIRLHDERKRNNYYDSKLYDIFPVKEKAVNVTKEEKLPRKEIKRPVDMRCWTESTRSKPRRQTMTAHHQDNTTVQYYTCRRSTHQKENKNRLRKSPNRSKANKVDKISGPTDTSKSCCVDCSEIYPKPLQAARRTENPDPEPVRPIFRKNAECLSIDVDANNLTITRSIQIDINSTENKTEETLNQIKSILQSVLAEVKTNPQMNNAPEAKLKKDAVVQNVPSQSNIQTCSSLLHSFTYNNSFKANPFISSCSHQAPSILYPNIPSCERHKYTQNFPLLIQTPAHPTYGCFYNGGRHADRVRRRAATTATNTDKDEQATPGNETDKLIREIYKSIALTLDFPKDTSNSEYDDLKSETNNSSGAREIRSKIVATDSHFRDIMTPISTDSVCKNNTSSIATGPDLKKENIQSYLDYESQTEAEEMKEPYNRRRGSVASTISEHYSEEISTDAESERETAVRTNEDTKAKTEKKSLLRRMLGSVFNKRNSNKGKRSTKQDLINETDGEKSASDSEDYETIYSDKSYEMEQRPRRRHQSKRGRCMTSQPAQHSTRGNRRSPYMEQEYRRRWDEQLIFKENRGRRYSSERPYSVQQTPVYWQNYEARSAVVDRARTHTNPVANVPGKMDRRTSPYSIVDVQTGSARPALGWLKRRKLGVSQCGEQWKKFILES